jgi:hypothetical protein
MKNDCNLEDFHNGAVSSFKVTLSNVTAVARICLMEMGTAFIHTNIQHCNKMTAIHQHGPINVRCLTTSIHVHETREHTANRRHISKGKRKSTAAKHYAMKTCGGMKPLILTPGTRWQWSASVGINLLAPEFYI